jgi:cytochrome c553
MMEMLRMKNMNVALPLALATVVALAAPAAHAADVAAGQAKAKEVCAACHGLDGNSPNPDYPKLAGQYDDYIAKALRDYKSDRRKNPIMAGFAKTLTPKDIDNLAAYFSAQKPVLESRF